MRSNYALIGQEAASPGREVQTREGTRGDRPGPQGGSGPDGRAAAYPHPLQALWAFRGPLRWDMPPLYRCWVVPGIALPIPTRYTHPVYPPARTAPLDVAAGGDRGPVEQCHMTVLRPG